MRLLILLVFSVPTILAVVLPSVSASAVLDLLLNVTVPSVPSIFSQPTFVKYAIDRILEAGYSAEEHTVQTRQGYILTMHRITASPNIENPANKPAVLLQHGILCSSDLFVLDQNRGLGFNLADQGFDVWLGNARGNTYSRKHITRSPLTTDFWDFSFHEIAIDDVPSMVDYVRNVTNQDAIHYVGHSQGTSVAFALLASDPAFGQKLKTVHALAPVAYLRHAESLIVRSLSPILGQINLRILFGSAELLPHNVLFSILAGEACKIEFAIQDLCRNFVYLLGGFGSQETDDALVPDFLTAFPAGSSVDQFTHFFQIAQSDIFRQFDYIGLGNVIRYGRLTPPVYDLTRIQNLIYNYVAPNDALANLIDVERLESELPNVDSYRIDKPTFQHFDFFLGRTVKEDVNDIVVARISDYEHNNN